MNRIFFIFIFVCVSVLFSNRTYAQLNYQEGISLSVDTIANPNYGITINKFNGIDLFTDRALFRVEINHTLCYVRGSGWAVYFYNPITQTYNDIRALDIRQSANGEIYDSWIEEDNSASKLALLRPVSYYLTNKSDSINSRSTIQERHIGFIAQDVEKIIPNAIATGNEGHKYIDYMRLLPIAVCSIGTLNNQLEINRQKINQIKKRIETTSK